MWRHSERTHETTKNKFVKSVFEVTASNATSEGEDLFLSQTENNMIQSNKGNIFYTTRHYIS